MSTMMPPASWNVDLLETFDILQIACYHSLCVESAVSDPFSVMPSAAHCFASLIAKRAFYFWFNNFQTKVEFSELKIQAHCQIFSIIARKEL
jgi:hypothetical protein|tara:strand:+ start:591 stop:866 length:276 start_codon:yes stop_codon:yes gene_type:complete